MIVAERNLTTTLRESVGGESDPPTASHHRARSGAFSLDRRSEEVLNLRCSGETLESIGRRYGLTRERIRQVASRAQSKISSSPEMKEILSTAESQLATSGYLSGENLTRIVAAAAPTAVPGATLTAVALARKLILDNGAGTEQSFLVVADQETSALVVLVVEAYAKVAIESGSCTLSKVMSELSPDLTSGDSRARLERLLNDCGEELAQIAANRLEERRRAATGPTLAREALEKAGEGLHHSVIAKRVNTRRAHLGLKPLNPRYVHSLLTYNEEFSYRGAGTYGLRKWGDDVPLIKDAIHDALEHAGRPLAFGQIWGAVCKVRSIKKNSAVLYLDMHPDFYRARSGKYGLRKWLPERPTLRTSRDYVETARSAKRAPNSSRE